MTSGDLPRILKIPAAGEDFILVHVSSTGRHAHDLKLIGTDGADVYSVKGKVTADPAGWTLDMQFHALSLRLIKWWYHSKA
jgi:hypothetical protein